MVTEISAGRQREFPEGWSVEITTTTIGWFRDTVVEQQYFKRDSEAFWEDELGWFVDPKSVIAEECDAAIKKFAGWQK